MTYVHEFKKRLKKVTGIEVEYDVYMRNYDEAIAKEREETLDTIDYRFPALSEQVNVDFFTE